MAKKTCVKKENETAGKRRLDANEVTAEPVNTENIVDETTTESGGQSCHEKFAMDKAGLLDCLGNIYSVECNSAF